MEVLSGRQTPCLRTPLHVISAESVQLAVGEIMSGLSLQNVLSKILIRKIELVLTVHVRFKLIKYTIHNQNTLR